MRVFIPGIDGYLGWSLAQYLAARNHEVAGCDIGARRQWVKEVGSQSATPISNQFNRFSALKEHYGDKIIEMARVDLTDYDRVKDVLMRVEPDAIVHLGEMPSAPYSMIDAKHACYTHRNNLEGTVNILWAMRDICPRAQLVKLGTMGEYGTPNVDIPEGYFELEYRGRKDRAMFPRKAGSYYHLTKVHDTHIVDFACRMWGLRSTDIMQGVVYGTRIPEMEDDERMLTRYDYDQCFGTAINRYCAQAVVGEILTPFGKGHQKRGFLPLADSMQCLLIAITNPPEEGCYRTFNQFEEVYDITELAERVKAAANELGIDAKIANIENPRKEDEEHYYNPDHQHLLDLGYTPTRDMHSEIKTMLTDLDKYQDRIIKEVLIPDIRWDGTRRKSRVLEMEEA